MGWIRLLMRFALEWLISNICFITVLRFVESVQETRLIQWRYFEILRSSEDIHNGLLYIWKIDTSSRLYDSYRYSMGGTPRELIDSRIHHILIETTSLFVHTEHAWDIRFWLLLKTQWLEAQICFFSLDGSVPSIVYIIWRSRWGWKGNFDVIFILFLPIFTLLY